MMAQEKNLHAPTERGEERRKGERRKIDVDPMDLPFPDRRKTDRRQVDRRVISHEEGSEVLKRIAPPKEKPEA